MNADARIVGVTLDDKTVRRRRADIEHECLAAIADLLDDNFFQPASGRKGPFQLRLAIAENRLNLDLRSKADGSCETIVLPLAPFRSIVKDYFLVCESHYQALQKSNLAQIEALDAGRRSLHDEGSTLLQERLADKVAMDHDTARRLFTLICVLHLRG